MSPKNTDTRPAKKTGYEHGDDAEDYCSWFYDLEGGKTEYVITIASVIGKSRMKGEKVVTNLVPYGPERPKNGILEKAGTNQLDLFWDPPKGEFTKYTLSIDKLVVAPKDRGVSKSSSTVPMPRNQSSTPAYFTLISDETLVNPEELGSALNLSAHPPRRIENLSRGDTYMTSVLGGQGRG